MQQGERLKHALASWGFRRATSSAAGDGENDHALLEMSEYSCATANAIATLKDAADRVTERTHGDGVLEIIEAMIASDLASLPPKKRRRALCLGRDSRGGEVILPSRAPRSSSPAIRGHTTELGSALLERLCKSGYQVCVLDTRGDYLDFKRAGGLRHLTNPPAVDEVLTALEKPDVQTVVCLAAVAQRSARASSRSYWCPCANCARAPAGPTGSWWTRRTTCCPRAARWIPPARVRRTPSSRATTRPRSRRRSSRRSTASRHAGWARAR
jgi:hypothetical protein